MPEKSFGLGANFVKKTEETIINIIKTQTFIGGFPTKTFIF